MKIVYEYCGLINANALVFYSRLGHDARNSLAGLPGWESSPVELVAAVRCIHKQSTTPFLALI